MNTGIGLYGSGMHDFVLRECEVGFRVAIAEDDEAVGFGPLVNVLLIEEAWRNGIATGC